MGLCDEQGCRQVHMAAMPEQNSGVQDSMLLGERYEELRVRLEEAERADLGVGLGQLGSRAAQISTWLDEQIPLTNQALTLCRVSKCANEAGEALDALEKAMGINPRKGVCGSWADVRKELLDVAFTALCAYEHLDGNLGGSGQALLAHAESRLQRVGLLSEAQPIPVDEKAPLTEWVEALRSEG